MSILPDLDVLLELDKTHTRTQIARMYGVRLEDVSRRLCSAGYYAITASELAGQELRRAILRAIVDYKRMHGGCSPTLRYLASVVGRVHSVIAHHLDLMENDKWIRRLAHGRIVVVGARWTPPAWIAELEDPDATL